MFSINARKKLKAVFAQSFIYSLVVILTASGCAKRYKESRFLLGTVVEVTIYGRRSECQNCAKLVFDEIGRIEKLMSIYDTGSDVSKINRQAGKSAVKVSPDTLEVVDQAINFARLSDGALDITVGALVSLWGFDSGQYRIPSDTELADKFPLVGYEKISLNKDRSTVGLALPDMQIDLGAISVGYAVDRVIQVLRKSGVSNALINAGGEIYALGSPPRKDAWTIGIQHPRRRNDLLGVIKLKDMAVSTSGDYEKFAEINGRRYCHIIDPKTGKPVEGIMSVTVIADSTIEADALSTAIFPMRAEKGMELIERLEGVDCAIVTGKSEDDMDILISSGIKGKIQLKVQ